MSLLETEVYNDRVMATDSSLKSEYLAYRETLASYNTSSPQVQGIDNLEDYQAASLDDSTVKAQVDGMAVAQIFNTKVVSWLNESHIADIAAQTVQEAGAKEKDVFVLHASESMPTDSPSTVDFIGKLLSSGGSVLIEYPDADSEYVERAHRIIESSGSNFTYSEIGQQTYFSGVNKELNPDEWTEKRALRAETIPADRMESIFYDRDEVVDEHGIITRSIGRIPLEVAMPMFEFVDEAFDSISDHPCRQGWSKEEFVDIATETPSVIKVIAGKEDISSVIAFGSKLGDFPWVNENYFRKYYTDNMDKGNLIYFPTVAKDPSKLGERAMMSTIPFIVEGLAEVGDVRVCFDSCDRNRLFLPKLIEAVVGISGISTIEFEEVAAQKYGLFTPVC